MMWLWGIPVTILAFVGLVVAALIRASSLDERRLEAIELEIADRIGPPSPGSSQALITRSGNTIAIYVATGGADGG